MIRLTAALPLTLLLTAAGGTPAEPIRGCMSHPALHGDRLVFESAGDLWMARLPADPAAPIEAARLTSGSGTESWPVFSRDGTRLAFAAEYDGNVETYVMPAAGGAPQRLTFHPGRDVPLGWTPDGSAVYMRSQRLSPLGRWELFRVPAEGGLPVRLPMGECSLLGVDPQTGRLAFTRWSTETWHWRGYRGGSAPDIWVTAPDGRHSEPLMSTPWNELFPMWCDGRIWFLSDENGRANLWSVTPEGGDRRMHTRQEGPEAFDVRWPSADAGGAPRIVFAQECDLWLLDARDGAPRRLDVRLVGDRLDERPILADPMDAISGMALSPAGDTLAIDSRGEILIVPVGDPRPGRSNAWRQLPGRSEARDAGTAWVGDSAIAFVTDAGGEPGVVLRSLSPDGVEEERTLASPGQWIFPPVASPDGSHLAYADKSLRLHLVDVASGADTVVGQAEAGEITDYRFSPDGRWLAWARPLRTGFQQLVLWSLDAGKEHVLGDGLTDDREPRWDPAGKYLYFLSNRHIDPVLDQFDASFLLENTTEAWAIPLAASTPPPLREVAAAAGFDLEAWATPPEPADDEAPAEPAKQPKPAAGAAGAAGHHGAGSRGGSVRTQPLEAAEPLTVDVDGMMARAVRLPVKPGKLLSLEAVWGGAWYLRMPVKGLSEDVWPPPALGQPGAELGRVDLVAGKEDEPVAKDVEAYTLNDPPSVAAWVAKDAIHVLPLGSDPKEASEVDLSGVRVAVDVRKEWRQIFDEAWRLQRDFFWRPDYGGVNWDAMRTKYAALLPRVGSRAELNDLIGELMAELGNSHLYVSGGDAFRPAEPVSVGMLGIDVEAADGGIRISRILPDASAMGGPQSPLAAPHLGVKAGQFLRAIDGQRVPADADPGRLLVGRGGQPVRVTVADDAAGANARTVEVTALPADSKLRYLDWVETNRRWVDKASNGALGYIHLPDMDTDGLIAFARGFYPQLARRGLVVDIRDNGGGFVSQMVLERLARRVYAWTRPRHGTLETYPQRTLNGPVAVIIDQGAGSDGDIFPESFRLRGLGPLVGTRTWGGVVGIRGDKPFVDGGASMQPEFAWWEPLRGYSLENSGVSPDIEVQLTPDDRVAGRDPQLERTVQLLMESVAKLPPPPDLRQLPAPGAPGAPGGPGGAPGSAAAPRPR